MATNDSVLDSLGKMDRYIKLMAPAATTDGLVDVVRAYLASWSRARILSLQAMDAGWAPFDDDQRPLPIHDAEDVRQVCIAVRNQCTALRAAGLKPTPELLEVDLFFFFANMSVEILKLKCANMPSQTTSFGQEPGRSQGGSRRAGRGLGRTGVAWR